MTDFLHVTQHHEDNKVHYIFLSWFAFDLVELMMQKASFFPAVLFDCSFRYTESLIRTLHAERAHWNYRKPVLVKVQQIKQTVKRVNIPVEFKLLSHDAVDWLLFLFSIQECIDWLNYDCWPKAALTCTGQLSISGCHKKCQLNNSQRSWRRWTMKRKEFFKFRSGN